MGSLNKAMILGNLGRDAELRYTTGGSAVAKLRLATNEVWTDKAGQKQEHVEWHSVVVWGKQAESLEPFLKKGKQILVEGSIRTRKWQDKDSGKDRYATEIKADRITLLGSAGGGSSRRGEDAQAEPTDDDFSQDAPAAAAPALGGDAQFDDDIPFVWLLPIIVPALLGLAMYA